MLFAEDEEPEQSGRDCGRISNWHGREMAKDRTRAMPKTDHREAAYEAIRPNQQGPRRMPRQTTA